MKIKQSKVFRKQFENLARYEQEKVQSAMVSFRKNPYAWELRNHPLKWKKKGVRSLSAGHDLRIIYREEENTVILLQVGSHNQVYGK